MPKKIFALVCCLVPLVPVLRADEGDTTWPPALDPDNKRCMSVVPLLTNHNPKAALIKFINDKYGYPKKHR